MLTKRFLRMRKHSGRLLRLFSGLKEDPWKVLGVGKNANEKDVKKAYVRLVKKYHPDVVKDGGEKFKEVQKAYEIMSNPAKMRDYEMKNQQQNFNNQRQSSQQGPFSTGNNPYGNPYSGFNQRTQTQNNSQRTYYYTTNQGSNPNQRVYYTYTSRGNPGGKTFEDVIRDAYREQEKQQQRYKKEGQRRRQGFSDYSGMSEQERKKMEEDFKRAEEELLNFMKFGSFGGGRSRSSHSKQDGQNPNDPFDRFDRQYQGDRPGSFGSSPFDHYDPIEDLKRRAFANIFIFTVFFFFLISLFRNPQNEELEQSYAKQQQRYNRQQKREANEKVEYILVLDNRTGLTFEATLEEYDRLKRQERGRFSSQGSNFR